MTNRGRDGLRNRGRDDIAKTLSRGRGIGQ